MVLVSLTRLLIVSFLWPIAALGLSAQTPAGCKGKVYGSVCLPQGQISFADEVVSFVAGADPATARNAVDPKSALGAPDIVALSLGCDGVLTLRFVNNALVDVKGPDLYVYETGRSVEPTALAISVDNKSWIDIGQIEGSTSTTLSDSRSRSGN